MTETPRPFIPLSALPVEDREAQNTRYGSKGLRVTPLASTGRFSISDTWGILVSRADVARLMGEPEAPEDASTFGFDLAELQKALFALFFPGGWDFSMPKAWGWDRPKAGSLSPEGKSSVPTTLTTSASASDLGF